MKSTGWPHIFIQTIGSWGLGRMENGAQSVLVLFIDFQACQPDNVLLPGAGSPEGGLIFPFDNLASASGLGVLLGVSGPLGTFSLPVPFLMTVDILISP
jgi:hypothetical protein